MRDARVESAITYQCDNGDTHQSMTVVYFKTPITIDSVYQFAAEHQLTVARKNILTLYEGQYTQDSTFLKCELTGNVAAPDTVNLQYFSSEVDTVDGEPVRYDVSRCYYGLSSESKGEWTMYHSSGDIVPTSVGVAFTHQ